MKEPSFKRILAGQLYDPHLLKLLPNRVIVVDRDTGLITSVDTFTPSYADAALSDPHTIDLRHLTVCPGLVDVHVHFFLHSYAETSWEDQVTKESLAERTVRATVHARQTLMAGYTAVRDLGTEGAEDADIALRKCLSGPGALIPGPRYFTANRAIVSTGSYGPRSSLFPSKEGVEGVVGAEAADGTTECMRVVRKQIGAGADWIKIYADYPIRSRLADMSPRLAGRAIATFSREELQALIDTAHRAGIKVAAHAKTAPVIKELLALGVDSLEHGSDIYTSPEIIKTLVSPGCKTVWVPTLAAYYSSRERNPAGWEASEQSFRAVLAAGLGNIAIACGGDTGVFPHGQNALEMELMVLLGAPWKWVLRWATLGGWEAIRGYEAIDSSQTTIGDNAVPFGSIRPGWAADLVGFRGDLASDFGQTVRRVEFVMKAGRVHKHGGTEIA
ncbi:unnamed protein product [Mycena citricolor]|uniref:Amidohydrolase-related domain-containing protein n=1 Tax=Mycena citricolor TaxID=2018698 RepID=A0AAD2K2K5_9AGAR|nr:unnamed protein product [Mycena citricolor]CAK5274108.1 unnamed protein product [Mycena citricolor]